MPEFLEKKLKARYGAKSKVPYMIMNKLEIGRASCRERVCLYV